MAFAGVLPYKQEVRALFPVLLSCVLLWACPKGPGVPAEDATGDEVDAGGVRAYLLGTRAEGYDIALNPPRVASLEMLAEPLRAEMLIVPLDLLGIPWTAFEGPQNQPTVLPAAWLARVIELEEMAVASGLPIALAMTPLGPAWDALAPLADDASGVLTQNPLWKPYCHDPADDGDPARWRNAYGGFAVWAVKRFQPAWAILGQRMNRYEENCGQAAYDSLLAYASEAHERLQALEVSPTTVVTVDVDDLYGYPRKPGRCVTETPEQCLAGREHLLNAIAADVLGLESYPAEAFKHLGGQPPDWLDLVADVRPDLAAVVAGTHLPGLRIETLSGACIPLWEGDEDTQRAWLDQVLSTAASRGMAWVAWTPLQDPLDGAVVASCPCFGDGDVCNHLGFLGASADELRLEAAAGLWQFDGAGRSGGEVWHALLATP